MSWEIWQTVIQDKDENSDDKLGEYKYERKICDVDEPSVGYVWIEGYKAMFWNNNCPEWVYYEVRPADSQ